MLLMSWRGENVSSRITMSLVETNDVDVDDAALAAAAAAAVVDAVDVLTV